MTPTADAVACVDVLVSVTVMDVGSAMWMVLGIAVTCTRKVGLAGDEDRDDVCEDDVEECGDEEEG